MRISLPKEDTTRGHKFKTKTSLITIDSHKNDSTCRVAATPRVRVHEPDHVHNGANTYKEGTRASHDASVPQLARPLWSSAALIGVLRCTRAPRERCAPLAVRLYGFGTEGLGAGDMMRTWKGHANREARHVRVGARCLHMKKSRPTVSEKRQRSAQHRRRS